MNIETRNQTGIIEHLLAELLAIRWQPNRDTTVAGLSYLLVVTGLYTAFQVITIANVAANFILFGIVSLAGIGVALPVFYTVLKRHVALGEVGLTTRHLAISLVLGGILGLDTYRNTLATLNVTGSLAIVPVIAMALAVGLFEAVFFRGWLQLRFEQAFGLIPGIVLAAVCYALYHVGYGMTAAEMTFLFGLGITFAVVFRLTRNIAVLWPLYTPIGGLYTNLKEGLNLPFDATYGFVIVLVMMFALIGVAARLGARARTEDC
jgi:uncharacterized protein